MLSSFIALHYKPFIFCLILPSQSPLACFYRPDQAFIKPGLGPCNDLVNGCSLACSLSLPIITLQISTRNTSTLSRSATHCSIKQTPGLSLHTAIVANLDPGSATDDSPRPWQRKQLSRWDPHPFPPQPEQVHCDLLIYWMSFFSILALLLLSVPWAAKGHLKEHFTLLKMFPHHWPT